MSDEALLAEHEALVCRLMAADFPSAGGAGPRRIQTHISSVLLTGDFAYKLKKPVDLGFLDFRMLAQRRHFCEEELRLNRRLAPDIYLDVVPVYGTAAAPRLGAGEPVIDYAVKMREFPQSALLDGMLARGEVSGAQLDALARMMAGFHAQAAVAGDDSPYGGLDAVAAAVLHNFTQLRARLEREAEQALLAPLEAWSQAELRRLAPRIAARKRGGFVRECHGDLHLGNIAWFEGAPQVFDCIEFNPGLRWIDVMSEVAFLAMDLSAHGRPDLAWRFIDVWLSRSGDYAGVALLNFYRVYRALVRAKVALLRAVQAGIAAEDGALAGRACRGYVELAARCAEPARGALLITHGLSGSGKSSVSQALLEQLGCVRLRSDVERKRLAGLAAEASSRGLGADFYGVEMTRRTYGELERLAGNLLESGQRVIVDAAFLRRDERDAMAALARRAGVAFVILHCHAPPELLRQRVARRAARGGDASEATVEVLERQMEYAQPLEPEEQSAAVSADTSVPDEQALVARVGQALGLDPR